MKRILKFIIPIFILLALINLTPIRGLFDWLVDTYHYEFANSSGDFYIMASSAGDFSGVHRRWNTYRKDKDINANDTTLYRLFWRNPFAFWRYYNYFDPIYDLPYRNKKEIPGLRSER